MPRDVLLAALFRPVPRELHRQGSLPQLAVASRPRRRVLPTTLQRARHFNQCVRIQKKQICSMDGRTEGGGFQCSLMDAVTMRE